jgi:hypothetical protein
MILKWPPISRSSSRRIISTGRLLESLVDDVLLPRLLSKARMTEYTLRPSSYTDLRAALVWLAGHIWPSDKAMTQPVVETVLAQFFRQCRDRWNAGDLARSAFEALVYSGILKGTPSSTYRFSYATVMDFCLGRYVLSQCVPTALKGDTSCLDKFVGSGAYRFVSALMGDHDLAALVDKLIASRRYALAAVLIHEASAALTRHTSLTKTVAVLLKRASSARAHNAGSIANALVPAVLFDDSRLGMLVSASYKSWLSSFLSGRSRLGQAGHTNERRLGFQCREDEGNEDGCPFFRGGVCPIMVVDGKPSYPPLGSELNWRDGRRRPCPPTSRRSSCSSS